MDKIMEFCERYLIRKLSLFGSVLRDDFRQKAEVQRVHVRQSHQSATVRVCASERFSSSRP